MHKILLTGSSGFLGKVIHSYLIEKGFTLKTLGKTQSCNYQVDLSHQVPVFNESFNIVIHAAGFAHPDPRIKRDNQRFHDVNLQGTVNLCKALEKTQLPKSFVFVSSVAVYGIEEGEMITELLPLNGTTPYAVSKIKAEQFLTKWSEKNRIILGILRPALITGPNPPGKLQEMILGIRRGTYATIRNNKARKSMVLATDVAQIIPKLMETGGIYNICDDYHPLVSELEILIANQLGVKKIPIIPLWLAKLLALTGNYLYPKFPLSTAKLKNLTSTCTFSNQRAKSLLDFQPNNVLENFRIK